MQLTADFDFNRVTQTSEKFDPEGRVMRSSQTREESSGSTDSRDAGQVSVGNELPNAPQRQNEPNSATREQNRKSEEIVNYEISRSTKTEVTEGGRVNRISVAVLVDGAYTKNDKGEADGTDVEPTIAAGAPWISLSQDGTRYFDWHHTPDDTLDKIDPVQLRQNVAAWTTMLAVLSGGIEPGPKQPKRR